MQRRHPQPIFASAHRASHTKTWLFTDARLGQCTLAIAAQLPPGSGIVVRDDHLSVGQRWRLTRQLVRIAKARRLVVLLAASPAVAQRWGADGVYLRRPVVRHAAQAKKIRLLVSMPVHDRREARKARRAAADVAFISPLYPTRSHPRGATIGAREFAVCARLAGASPVALGGMTAPRARRLRHQLAASGVHPGWAAIDDWAERADARRQRQKRNCVPT